MYRLHGSGKDMVNLAINGCVGQFWTLSSFTEE